MLTCEGSSSDSGHNAFQEEGPTSLELGDRVYSSSPGWDSRMELEEEGSDAGGYSLCTLLAFFWAQGATLEEAGTSVLKSVGKRKGINLKGNHVTFKKSQF